MIFGVLHIGNAFSNPIGTLIQILFATGIGILFAAVYLRTRNLWSCILAHAINDFCAAIDTIHVPLQADIDAYNTALAEVPQLLIGRIPQETLISIAPLLQLTGLPLAVFVAVMGIYMMRPAKAKQINQLWAWM